MTDPMHRAPAVSGTEPLADSRFFRPPLPSSHVPRPRLCERLGEGLGGRLLLVCAPAGFGKSSLASEFCQALPEQWNSLWLGLSSRDSDPGRFLERLLAGLQQFYPGLGEEAQALLRMRQRHQPFAFEQWLDGLLDELGELLDPAAPLLLVLDDYHLAQGAVLDRCLQFFLNHLPAGLLLLVTSRQRPDWHLARLRLSRQLLELQEQDLHLSEEETRALLCSQGVEFSGPVLEQWRQRSEGWVAGLRLWLLTRQQAEGESLERVPQGDEGLVREYLLEEVIEQQPAEVQSFLFDTACLERFCVELCDALREQHDSAAIIQHLQTHQIFLVPLDEQGHWFRYHHLFSDLLRSRPAAHLSQSQAALHLRACRWFSAQGLHGEAIDQALRAGQPEVAASLVQNLSEEQLLGEQNVARLLRWKIGFARQSAGQHPAPGGAVQLGAGPGLPAGCGRRTEPAVGALSAGSAGGGTGRPAGPVAGVVRGDRPWPRAGGRGGTLLQRSPGPARRQALWPALAVPDHPGQPGDGQGRSVARPWAQSRGPGTGATRRQPAVRGTGPWRAGTGAASAG